MLHKALVLIHLVGFAAYVGAAFAQQRLMAMSAAETTPPTVRDAYERLAANILVRIELPALFAQVAVGVVFIALLPDWLKQGWLHGKLTCVAALLVLSHLEMFNARRIVKARAERGESASADIAGRKRRHARFGAIDALAVAVLLLLVAYGTA
ncbi:MAG TPA: CopD family protein [Polyangiaceae bacterium]|jgi:putative membrane protein